MGSQVSNSKRILSNTIFLYVRMIVTMIIGLYTSRILLQELGVDDFGIYGLVGGIVAMFSSLKTLFAVATQRYLNIEIGKGDIKELNKVFNVSVLVNLLIAFIFLIIVEIGGIWLLENKLHIPLERMIAARWVLQFSIVSSVITILCIPYDANIIARERMNVFATLSIFDSVAKLAIVLLLPFWGGDRLIVYGGLMLCIVVINLGVNVAYCRLKFVESRIIHYPFSSIIMKFKEMFKFSGWAFFGNIMFALVNEGINVLLNIFSGVTANAARNITYQVKSALANVVSNVYVAVKPQAIQSYARQDMERFYNLMFTGAKVVGYMYILMAIPLFFALNEILRFWLGTVPDYAVVFLSASLLYQYVRVLHESVGIFFVTIGKLKAYQVTEFFTLGSALPLSYVGLSFLSMPLYGVFLVMTFSELLNLIVILCLAKKEGNFDVHRYFISVLFPYAVITLLCISCVWSLKWILGFLLGGDETVNAFILIVLAVVCQLVLIYFAGLRKKERLLLLNIIKRRK